jgi:multidrug efflux pump subunit AcrA (membrane-fusion protein)
MIGEVLRCPTTGDRMAVDPVPSAPRHRSAVRLEATVTDNPDTRLEAPSPGASKRRTMYHHDQRMEDGGAPPTQVPAQASAGEVSGSENSGTGRFPRFTGSRRVAVVVIAVLALLAIAGFAGAYFLHSRNYVSTDNAQVDGDKIDINSPATGTLSRWSITKGSPITTNQVVGRVKILGSFAEPQMPVKSPGTGTVAINNVVQGQYVTAGTELATGYDFTKIYVTARVDETDIPDVHPGRLVDIDVDAYPDTPVTGTVEEIQGAAAGLLSLFPESNSTGNFQKVTQVIPVRIAFLDTRGLELIPGMNVTVHIHKK